MRRIFAITALATAVATQGVFTQIQNLAEDTIDIAYDSTLACGACVRGGYYYCLGKDDDKSKGRGPNDVCCNTADCLFQQAISKGAKCGTYAKDDSKSPFKDRYVMLQKFCAKRQDQKVCCPKKKSNDDGCEIKLKYREWDNFTISLNQLPYGGSCTYKVDAKCGYPNLVVNNSNIDMIVAYKKKDWEDDKKVDPSDDDEYDDDETVNPVKDKNGNIKWQMKNKEKKDKDENDCQKVKFYLTLTNLLNPTKPTASESRLLEASDPSLAMLSFAATETGAPDSGLKLAMSATLAAVMLAFTIAF